MAECPNCKHEHDVWDVNIMAYTHTDTVEFVRIQAIIEAENSSGYKYIQSGHLLGCPKCKTVFLGDNF